MTDLHTSMPSTTDKGKFKGAQRDHGPQEGKATNFYYTVINNKYRLIQL